MIEAIATGAAVLICVVWAHNRLVACRNGVGNAWAQIDVQLRRRGELVPNLVACVKGYIAHENEVLKAIVEIRRQIDAAGGDIAARVLAESNLGQSLWTVMSTAEAVPQLRASQNFLALQEELRTTENRIGFARQHYNDSVMRYNVMISSFPTNLIANLFAFKPAVMFSARDADMLT
jgi:LemA protein